MEDKLTSVRSNAITPINVPMPEAAPSAAINQSQAVNSRCKRALYNPGNRGTGTQAYMPRCQKVLECTRMYQYVLDVHSNLCFRLFQNKFWALFAPFDLPGSSETILNLVHQKLTKKIKFSYADMIYINGKLKACALRIFNCF